jgi:Transglycosylase SLT domain
MPLAALLITLVLALAGCGDDDEGSSPRAERAAGEGPPAAGSPLPRSPAALADRLTNTQRGLDRAVDDWRAQGDPSRGAPPGDVTLYALDQQRGQILLSGRPRLAHSVLARLPGRVAAHARASIRARRMLGRLSTPQPLDRFRTGPARPAGELLRHYREAQRRFGVSWQVLAAVNLVESAFGRTRNTSTAGAQGPMQFIPSTWAAYGMGGDIRDPHDAILGAANYLHASGAPRDYRTALYRYNPSRLYVDAVLAYSDRIRRDARNFFAYYAWQVFVRTPQGTRRITGPGL